MSYTFDSNPDPTLKPDIFVRASSSDYVDLEFWQTVAMADSLDKVLTAVGDETEMSGANKKYYANGDIDLLSFAVPVAGDIIQIEPINGSITITAHDGSGSFDDRETATFISTGSEWNIDSGGHFYSLSNKTGEGAKTSGTQIDTPNARWLAGIASTIDVDDFPFVPVVGMALLFKTSSSVADLILTDDSTEEVSTEYVMIEYQKSVGWVTVDASKASNPDASENIYYKIGACTEVGTNAEKESVPITNGSMYKYEETLNFNFKDINVTTNNYSALRSNVDNTEIDILYIDKKAEKLVNILRVNGDVLPDISDGVNSVNITGTVVDNNIDNRFRIVNT